MDVKEAELNLQSAQKAVDQRRLEVGREVESKLSEIQYLADMVRIADLKYEKAALEHNAKVLQAANGLIPESEAKEKPAPVGRSQTQLARSCSSLGEG